jgi:phosphatidylglycerol lysyltransferase
MLVGDTRYAKMYEMQHSQPLIPSFMAPSSVLTLPERTRSTSLDEKGRAYVLTCAYGYNSIVYFGLRREKQCFFSPSGLAYISYAVEKVAFAKVAIVVGDPVGPLDEIPAVLNAFHSYCHERGWLLAFWQARAELVPLYRRAGMRCLKIGEDAVLQLDKFTLKGGAIANVRTSRRRAEKEGVYVRFYQGSIIEEHCLDQVKSISQCWLEHKGGHEMGFSMGHLEAALHDPEQVLALAIDQKDKVHGFVSFVPIYGRNGWGLDLMRRADDMIPGTMELLITAAIEHFRERGAKMMSLGLAPLCNMSGEEKTRLERWIDALVTRYGNLGHARSLVSFKKKFHPIWESRYLVFPHRRQLPYIGYALQKIHERDE